MKVHPFTALLAAMTVLAAIQTLSLGDQARRGPLMVLAPLIIGLGWQLYREYRDGIGADAGTGSSGRDVISACAWAAALPALVATLGFVAGPALFVVTFQRIRGNEGWPSAVAIAVALAAFVWLLFRLLLLRPPPAGVFDLLRLV